MLDVFDIVAFAVFAILLVAVVVLVVSLGQLPGQIAHKRGHPQAAAINVTGWLGIVTLGLLWPLALIWAFLKPFPGVSSAPAENKEALACQEGAPVLFDGLGHLPTGAWPGAHARLCRYNLHSRARVCIAPLWP
jgi:hypothetical protein